MSSITVILTAYCRPRTIAPCVEAIRDQTSGASEIWLWANEPSPDVAAALNRVLANAATGRVMAAIDTVKVNRVITSSVNAYFHARFALALTATTEYVAIFDDDTIPGPRWFENCLHTMSRTPGILGSAGVRLAQPNYHTATKHGWHEPAPETVAVDLVGHAWFLRTEWLHWLFAEPPVIGTNGEDIELAARAMRFAGITCYCPPHPPDDKSLWGSTRGDEFGNDAVASFRRSSHVAERDEIVRVEIEKGWRPMFMRGKGSGAERVSREAEDGRQEPERPSLTRRVSMRAETEQMRPEAEGGRREVGQSRREAEGERQEAERPSLMRRVSMRAQAEQMSREAGGAVSGVAAALADAVPASARRVLLVGPSDSPLFDELKVRPEIDVTVVEDLNHDAPFDCVVCEAFDAMRHPREFLAEMKRRLEPGGRFIAAAHNVRHHAVIEGLIEGEWGCGRGVIGPLTLPSPRRGEGGLVGESRRDFELSPRRGQGVNGLVGEELPEHARPRQVLRFYTRRELEKCFYRAGFHVTELRALPGAGFAEWESTGRPNQVRVGPLHIAALPPEEVEEFYAGGYVVNAALEIRGLTPPGSPDEADEAGRGRESPEHVACNSLGLTSIVIVTHNELEYTRQCIESIRDRTDEPFELIVVDNGSTDGTVEWLRSIQRVGGGDRLAVNGDRLAVVGDEPLTPSLSPKGRGSEARGEASERVRVIFNDTNRGFPAAANQGIQAARGGQILLLNNDTLVTTGWLRRMLDCMQSDPRIGLE